jgi:Domain of unknown function (DUF932)
MMNTSIQSVVRRPALATRFAAGTRVIQGHEPLSEDQMRRIAPSIFAEGKHASRSERYTWIPTIEVLRGLGREGFHPFMVAQGSSRVEGKAAFTKHMVRLRHLRDGSDGVHTRQETNEIILINSHDGASCYQLLAGVFRYICSNGLVVGDVVDDIRVPHRGDVAGEVIEGAVRVLEQFRAVDEHREAMQATMLEPPEQIAFATAALALRFGERSIEEQGGHTPAPVTAEQLNEARRIEDTGGDLWTTFQRVQQNLLVGGQPGRTAQGKRTRTRPIAAIDRSVNLNRALWRLAEEMRTIKAA